DGAVKSPDELVDLYFASVGRNAGLLLNVPPTRAGVLADGDVRNLAAFGERRGGLFATDVATNAHVRRSGDTIDLQWPHPVRFGVAALSEAIAAGQLVERFTLDARVGGAWATCAGGTTIGHQRLARFEPIETTRVRLVVQSTVGRPAVSVKLYGS